MESLNKISKSFFIGLFFISLLSCDSLNTVCTQEFRIIGMAVHTPDHEPVILDQLTVINLETNRVVEICDDVLGDCEKGSPAGYLNEGIYFIFHDGVRDEISGKKSSILVEGSSEEVNFQEKFAIGDNGCHVFKEAGPDTVFVEVE